VREAVFSILGPIDGLRVLDLFAGSGALGIEAVSRGAGEVTLVDSSREAAEAIRRNLATLGMAGELRHQKVSVFLEQASAERREYDLVFLDPPYRDAPRLGPELSSPLLGVLARGARVVTESAGRAPLVLEQLGTADERRYGDTLIRIYAKGQSDQHPSAR
jgi:16S rRNA (guanine966-N2)-methyltransferase